MKKELLAPAGDIEAGYAALYYGADAVYLGLQQFSARATAANFSEKDFDEFVSYAHSKDKKVFVALNTLVQEDELSDLLKTLDICSRYRADAVIIQDLGVARVVKEAYPELEMHASTQMAVHNKEGALALQKLGFSRVVVARELMLPEIEEIAAIPNLEIEAFIHGALCYSYSGLCLFSSLETGKSANRGKCLYPCRAEFCSNEGEKHFFSMKDLALQEDILRMPVLSLKIEGRKKTALYVAAVTDYYRKILDGKGADLDREENIKQIFSRPWTKLHFKGKNKDVIDQNFVGHRGLKIGKIEQFQKGRIIFKPSHSIEKYNGLQIDVDGQEKPFGFSLQSMRVDGKNVFKAQANETVEVVLPPRSPNLKKGQAVYLASSSLVKDGYDYTKPKAGEFYNKIAIDIKISISDKLVKAEAQGFVAEISGEFTPATQVEKVYQAAQTAFNKTGGTGWCVKNLDIENPNALFVPVSVFNELRRDLYEKIAVVYKSGVLPEISAIRNMREPQWIIKTDDVANLSGIDLDDVGEIIFLLGGDRKLEQLKNLPKNKVRIGLPAVCRKPKLLNEMIKSLLGQGYKKWEVANYWGMNVLPENGIDLSFDAPLYMMNTQAIQMAKEMKVNRVTLAIEDDLNNIKALIKKSSLPMVMIVYQDVPLFTSADCIRSNSCKDCMQGEKWIDLSKDGQKYQALSKDCQVMLFADKPLSLAAEAKEIRADYYRIDFCYKKYTPEKAAKIWNATRIFRDFDNVNKANIKRNL